MGLVDELAGARVFLDTPPIIYFIETSNKYAHIVRPVFVEIAAGNIEAMTSAVTLAEVLVHPYRKGQAALADKYRRLLLRSAGLTTFDILHEVADKAAQVRAQYGVRTPDALQLAVSFLYGADAFLTNDDNLRRVGGIQILMLDDHLA